MKPTNEQSAILDGFKTNPKIVVVAIAGSGKTSTLTMLAKQNPAISLYITFNKNMADEAKNKFPSHVDVRTSHSLAFRNTGSEISHKLVRPNGKYVNVAGTGSEIAKYFKIPPFAVGIDDYVSTVSIGYCVRDTVDSFQYSADKEIGIKHVNLYYAKKWLKDRKFDVEGFKKVVLQYAKMLWEKRIDPQSNVLCTHDTYMKLYQLSDPDLSGMYDIIYLDEAHDTNPCLMDIVIKQNCKIVMVGDPHQQIYGFRKAINALNQVDWPRYELSTSFRYGEPISEVARSILTENGVLLQNVVSHDSTYSEIHMEPFEDSYVKVFRTNAALISEAMFAIAEGKRINLNIDVSDFKNMVMSVEALKYGEMGKVKHPDLSMYKDWDEFATDMQALKSGELFRVFKLVAEGMGGKVIQILSSYKPYNDPDYLFTTAHKSKGLEYEYVVLADDFPYLQEIENDNEYEQERNLLYVALTRAKRCVVLNPQCYLVMEKGL